jgi:predicted small metal-binding protein
MAKVINCECGYTARGETDEELLSDVRQHVRDAHPDMEVSDEQLLAMAEES